MATPGATPAKCPAHSPHSESCLTIIYFVARRKFFALGLRGNRSDKIIKMNYNILKAVPSRVKFLEQCKK